VEPGEPLVVVPTARTWALPWTALHDGPVHLAPSAATWARSARRATPADSRVVLVAGPDLPGAVAEVQALATLHGDARVLLPPASTVDAVVAELPRAALAHLACHGALRADNPVFSSFRLSGGALTLHELDQQRRAPYRMVLSACDSGTGTALAGDELLGFVGALLARGTAGVLASCVPVPDAAVVPLMCAVHTRLRAGDTLAVALHASRSVLDPDDPRDVAAAYAFSACGAA
jgi:CHAT domain-containing protein